MSVGTAETESSPLGGSASRCTGRLRTFGSPWDVPPVIDNGLLQAGLGDPVRDQVARLAPASQLSADLSDGVSIVERSGQQDVLRRQARPARWRAEVRSASRGRVPQAYALCRPWRHQAGLASGRCVASPRRDDSLMRHQ